MKLRKIENTKERCGFFAFCNGETVILLKFGSGW